MKPAHVNMQETIQCTNLYKHVKTNRDIYFDDDWCCSLW